MPQKSSFFDSTASDPREYSATEFAEYFSRIVGNGVFGGGTSLKVTSSGVDTFISVSLGFGWINGYLYSVYGVPVDLQIEPNTANQDRIDRVIIRLDLSAPERSIKAIVLQGEPAADPAPPELTRAGNFYELSLAQIRMIANTAAVNPALITDERLNNDVCGIVTGLIDQADTTDIFNQFQNWFSQKTVEYQQEWDDFMIGVQDDGFATAESVNSLRELTSNRDGYGVTDGDGPDYTVSLTPAPTGLVESLRITVKLHADITGPSTINPNGLGDVPLKKANGNDFSGRAGGAYTFVLADSVFKLQGEGGEYGTATAGDVRAGTTIGADDGLVEGTLITQSAGPLTITPGATDIVKPAGIYGGSITVKAGYAKGSTIDARATGQAIVPEYQDNILGYATNVNIYAVSENYLFLSTGALVSRSNPTVALWTRNDNMYAGSVFIDEARGIVIGLYYLSGSGLRVSTVSIANGTQIAYNTFSGLGTGSYQPSSAVYLKDKGILYASVGNGSYYFALKADITGATIATASYSASYSGPIYYDSDADLVYYFRYTTGSTGSIVILSKDLVQQGTQALYDADGTTAVGFFTEGFRLRDGKSMIMVVQISSSPVVNVTVKLDMKARKIIWKYADNTMTAGMEFADGTILVSYGTIGNYSTWQRIDANGVFLPGISRNYGKNKVNNLYGQDHIADKCWVSFNSAYSWVKTKVQLS